MPEYSGTPLTKDCENPEAYTMHWDTETTPATENKTYKAVFEIKTFVVKFFNDTQLLKEVVVDYGNDATFDQQAPVKSGNAQFSYTFQNWVTQNGGNIQASLTNITSDTNVYACFAETVNSYTITFNNDDGTQLQQTQVEYGLTPSYTGATPTKTETAEFTYEFDGWSPTLVAVSENATYVAQFNQTKRSYTIVWKNGETTLKTETLQYGTLPAYDGTEPSKDATAEYTYTFGGWSPSITNVTQNTTYTAQFKQTKNKYAVVFKDYDGDILKYDVLEYGTTIIPPSAPTRPATKEYTYTFSGWQNYIDEMTVNQDVQFVASYTQTLNKYTITFNNDDGTQLQQTQVEYGLTPSYTGATPTKAETAEFTYEFYGWSPTLVAVSENATYVAQFNQTKRSYTIVWKNGETTLKTETLQYGALPGYDGTEPSKDATAEYTYTFDGWSPNITNVTQNTTYTAQFKQTKNKYAVVFKDYDGDILKYDVLEYGTTIIPPSAPTRPATKEYTYTFSGWQNYEADMIVTQDVQFVASYTQEVVKTVTVKDDNFNIEVDLDEDLANEASLVVTKQQNTNTSQTILNNKYENISNLVVYKISLLDSNDTEIESINTYAKIKIEVPTNLDKKNLVVYNLTTQKTVSFELEEDYVVCELNSFGDIALFNSQSLLSTDDKPTNQALSPLTFVLIGTNALTLVACIVIACLSKGKKKKAIKNELKEEGKKSTK